MEWKTWARISAVILFLLTLTGFYFNYFYFQGPVLEIQNFPLSSDLERLKTSEDYSFTFSLYNTGDRTAFVDIISIRTEPTLFSEVDPLSLTIKEKQTEDIQINLGAPKTETETTLTITVFYDGGKSISKTAILKWH